MKTNISLPKLTSTLVDILEDLKMTDIVVCDTKNVSIMFDKVIIATCNTSRQAYAALRDMRKAKLPVQNIEGQRADEWLLADCGAIVVHMMLPKIREYFRLEELWQKEEPKVIVSKAPPKKTSTEKAPIKSVEEKAPLKKTMAKKSVSPIKTTGKVTKTVVKKTLDKANRKVASKVSTPAEVTRAKKASATVAKVPAKKPSIKTVAKKKATSKTGRED